MSSSSKTDKDYMWHAIEAARKGINAGQVPFGACIVKDGEVIVCSHNIVWEKMDITAHAEVNVIRQACRRLGTVHLSGCIIYSTVEPCPMCFSACHWARISKIVYGAGIQDAKEVGFNELAISNEKMKLEGKTPVKVVGGVLEQECKKLLKEWSTRENKRVY